MFNRCISKVFIYRSLLSSYGVEIFAGYNISQKKLEAIFLTNWRRSNLMTVIYGEEYKSVWLKHLYARKHIEWQCKASFGKNCQLWFQFAWCYYIVWIVEQSNVVCKKTLRFPNLSWKRFWLKIVISCKSSWENVSLKMLIEFLRCGKFNSK